MAGLISSWRWVNSKNKTRHQLGKCYHVSSVTLAFCWNSIHQLSTRICSTSIPEDVWTSAVQWSHGCLYSTKRVCTLLLHPDRFSCLRNKNSRSRTERVSVPCSSVSSIGHSSWTPQGAWKAEWYLSSGYWPKYRSQIVHMHKKIAYWRWILNRRSNCGHSSTSSLSVVISQLQGMVNNGSRCCLLNNHVQIVFVLQLCLPVLPAPVLFVFYCLFSWQCSVCAWRLKSSAAYKSNWRAKVQHECFCWRSTCGEMQRWSVSSIPLEDERARAARSAAP